MVDLVYYLTNLLFLDISLLYYYINFRSSIIFRLSSGNIYTYLSLGISLSCSFVIASEIFYGKLFETFVILPSYELATVSALLIPIKSPTVSAAFRITLFEVVLSASVADYLA